MNARNLIARQWRLSLCYLAAATAAIALTRFEGGIAQTWGATAFLLAALMRTAPRHWWAPVLACVLPPMIATGLLGPGWAAAPAFALINAGEAIAAALVLRHLQSGRETLGNLRWVGAFAAACVAGPLVMIPIVAVTLQLLGLDSRTATLHFVTGHSLGNLIFTPIALMVVGQQARTALLATLTTQKKAVTAVVMLSLGTSLLVFAQTTMLLLYLASLSAMVATFLLGRTGAAASIAILAVAGTIAKVVATGPFELTQLDASGQLLMFQVFLAATSLTVLPVAAALRAQKKMVGQLREKEARFRMLAEHSSDIIMHLGVRGEFRFVSPAIRQLSGHDPAQMIGCMSNEFVHPDDRAACAAEHRACFAQPGEIRRFRYRARVADGSWRWVEASARAMVDDEGRPDGVISMLRDITDSKTEQDQWQKAALTDRLTGLPNRRALEAAVGAHRSGKHCIALLDLDRFKQVNDTYGHDAGDAVLCGFGKLARRMVRASDTVARIGGEEFVILFEHSSIEQAYEVCDQMLRMLGRTMLTTPAGPLRITASGGVAVIGRGGLTAALKAADEAMYRAKKGGRDLLLLAA